MYAFAADVLDEFEKIYTASVDTPLEALRNDIEGDYAQGSRGTITAIRGAAGAYISTASARSLLGPIVAQWCAASAVSPSDADSNWRAVYDYMIGSGDDLNSRAWSFGTPAAGGGNAGDATVLRLTTDESAEPMEAWWADTYTLECSADYLTIGQEHTAEFSLEGTDTGPDGLPWEGAPFKELGIPQLSDRNSVGISNPSFTLGTFSEPTITSMTGWSVGSDWANYEIESDSTYIYLDTEASGGTPYSLRQTANDYIYQELQETGGARIDPDTPEVYGFWCYRRDSADGTLTIRLTDVSAPTTGGVSRAVTVTTLTNGAWNWIGLTATPSENNWPANTSIEQLCMSIQLASLTTGSLYYDTVIRAPFTRVGSLGQAAKGRGCMGQYIAVLAGQSQTMAGDVWTWTDSETWAVNQGWSGMHGARFGYLPSDNAAGESVADK